MDLMFPTFSSFDKAMLYLIKEAPKFSFFMEKEFAAKKWTYSKNGLAVVPNLEMLTATILELINMLPAQERNLCAFASSGRITIKIFKIGKRYHPMMYCQAFSI